MKKGNLSTPLSINAFTLEEDPAWLLPARRVHLFGHENRLRANMAIVFLGTLENIANV